MPKRDRLYSATLNVNNGSHNGTTQIGRLEIPLKYDEMLLHSLSFQALDGGGNGFGAGRVVGQVSLDSATTWHEAQDADGFPIQLTADGAVRMIDPETANFTTIRIVMLESTATPNVTLNAVAWYGT